MLNQSKSSNHTSLSITTHHYDSIMILAHLFQVPTGTVALEVATEHCTTKGITQFTCLHKTSDTKHRTFFTQNIGRFLHKTSDVFYTKHRTFFTQNIGRKTFNNNLRKTFHNNLNTDRRVTTVNVK